MGNRCNNYKLKVSALLHIAAESPNGVRFHLSHDERCFLKCPISTAAPYRQSTCDLEFESEMKS